MCKATRHHKPRSAPTLILNGIVAGKGRNFFAQAKIFGAIAHPHTKISACLRIFYLLKNSKFRAGNPHGILEEVRSKIELFNTNRNKQPQ